MPPTPLMSQARSRPVTLKLTEEEYEFYQSLADRVGSSLAALLRNGASQALMTAQDPVDAARHQRVTELARMDKWARGGYQPRQPSMPPMPPKPMV